MSLPGQTSVLESKRWAARRWAEVAEIFFATYDKHERELEAEASGLSLGDDLAWVVRDITGLDPLATINSFREENPHIKVNHLKGEDPSEVALGVLRTYAVEAVEPDEPES
jgi:hypothetical protein